MGQKVNPHGLRVGVIKDWDSRWYASNEKVGDLLVEYHKIRVYLKKLLFAAGVIAPIPLYLLGVKFTTVMKLGALAPIPFVVFCLVKAMTSFHRKKKEAAAGATPPAGAPAGGEREEGGGIRHADLDDERRDYPGKPYRARCAAAYRERRLAVFDGYGVRRARGVGEPQPVRRRGTAQRESADF